MMLEVDPGLQGIMSVKESELIQRLIDRDSEVRLNEFYVKDWLGIRLP